MKVLIYSTSILSLGSAFLISFLSTQKLKQTLREDISLENLWELCKKPSLMLIMGAYFGHNWELFTAWKFVHQFLEEEIFPDSEFAAGLSAFFIVSSGSLSAFFIGHLTKRYRTTGALLLINFISTCCSALIGWIKAPWAVLAVGIVWGIFLVADSALYSATITMLAPQMKGTAATMQVSIGFLFTIPPMYILPYILDVSGSWGYSFLLGVPGSIVAFLCVLEFSVCDFYVQYQKQTKHRMSIVTTKPSASQVTQV